ncbi:MAG TPA: FliA/WhiG family RNA polymerase sigma factor [Phycisphaerae bacterium]|nr:FliA/WhiG family RNA polymerase sigma factor [Phycisphaerae bacterium]
MNAQPDQAPPPPAETLRARARKAYADQARETFEEKLILDYLPLVRHVVTRVAENIHQPADIEDLISAGTIGLIKAAREYDPSRKAEFKTYAYIRVRGAVIDELRRRSFVPSAVHGKLRQIRAAYEQLAGRLGRAPANEELAEAVGMTVLELYRTLEESRNQHFLSIHGLTGQESAMGDFIASDEQASPPTQAERAELRVQLARAITELPEKERLVILLYYERDLNMKETAEVLKVTESRVSQLHASAILRLSMKLQERP